VLLSASPAQEQEKAAKEVAEVERGLLELQEPKPRWATTSRWNCRSSGSNAMAPAAMAFLPLRLALRMPKETVRTT
jgi:hypothetical protein